MTSLESCTCGRSQEGSAYNNTDVSKLLMKGSERVGIAWNSEEESMKTSCCQEPL